MITIMLGVKRGFSEFGTLAGATLGSFPNAPAVSLTNCSWLTFPAPETVKFGPTK
jgi:hypothetical protein